VGLADALRRYRFRLRRGLADRGPIGLARDAARRVFAVDAEFVWYTLDLAAVKPLGLRTGYELRRATEPEQATEWLREVPAIRPDHGPRRLAEGVQLWFVLRDGEPAFTCSAFVDRYPLDEAPGGWYRLPERVASIDDALTNRKSRGLAVAPGAFLEIARRLRGDGFEVLITKIEPENVASRRTMEKIGFTEVGTMRRRRRGWRTRVGFDRSDAELTDAERAAVDDLARALSS
jgi:RimJ/RimL family protein N-acetyltransferase